MRMQVCRLSASFRPSPPLKRREPPEVSSFMRMINLANDGLNRVHTVTSNLLTCIPNIECFLEAPDSNLTVHHPTGVYDVSFGTYIPPPRTPFHPTTKPLYSCSDCGSIYPVIVPVIVRGAQKEAEGSSPWRAVPSCKGKQTTARWTMSFSLLWSDALNINEEVIRYLNVYSVQCTEYSVRIFVNIKLPKMERLSVHTSLSQ